MTIFRICQVESRRIFVFHVLSVCGLDTLWLVAPCFSHLVCSWRLGSKVVRGSRFLSLIYNSGSDWVVCTVALFATLSGSWFGILVVDFPF